MKEGRRTSSEGRNAAKAVIGGGKKKRYGDDGGKRGGWNFEPGGVSIEGM
jgi:hypothetical protein